MSGDPKIQQAWLEIRATFADTLMNNQQRETFVKSILSGVLANPPGTEIVPEVAMEALRRATISLGELAGITTLSTYDYAALDACLKVIKSADAHRDRTGKTTEEEKPNAQG